MSVNSLRKQSAEEEVISQAKSLIKGWKKLLPAQSKRCFKTGFEFVGRNQEDRQTWPVTSLLARHLNHLPLACCPV